MFRAGFGRLLLRSSTPSLSSRFLIRARFGSWRVPIGCASPLFTVSPRAAVPDHGSSASKGSVFALSKFPLRDRSTLRAVASAASDLQIRSFATAGGTQKSVEEIYQKKTQREHILIRPESYIGSMHIDTHRMWVFDESSGKMLQRDVNYCPGLYKIFDEILVNAADNRRRDANTTRIDVKIDVKNNRISVWNNGRGIPVRLHKTEMVYVPELVLGHLLTGSNFDDSEAKITGGRNGFGAKLTNTFSLEFSVDTVDTRNKKRFQMTWRNNMTEHTEPQITAVIDPAAEDYTCVTFSPDLAKFGVTSLSETDLLLLLRRRVYDLAGCLEGVQVSLDGKILPGGFENYVALFSRNGEETISVVAEQATIAVEQPAQEETAEDSEVSAGRGRVALKLNKRWELVLTTSPSESDNFEHVSFVNAIWTPRGGTHVNAIVDQIVRYLVHLINRQHKDVNVVPNMIRQHLFLFINCCVENPAFDSQTKETLTTKVSAFGSRCTLPQSFLKQVAEKTDIVERVITGVRAKQAAELMSRSAPATGRRRLLGIPKLEDANDAGGPDSKLCTLILTEGDSAKALAVSGLSVLGRDRYGVFPLKGKLLNVRDAQHKQLLENQELHNLKLIIGLDHEKTYKTAEERSTLRYGRVMLMTDQDHDGSHIKGLFINLVHHFWPELLSSGEFLEEFVTPIVKASRGKERMEFFTLHEYDQWKQSLGEEISKWKVKYYKGLGTSTSEEAKEYFSSLERHRIRFTWQQDDGELIKMAFAKENSNLRKDWIGQYDASQFVDHSVKELSVGDFIRKELILFSRADTMRCIASAVDGLKPGQRKVLYACFKRDLHNEIKVAQLAGYVSEHTGYHHGEASLHSTIVNMAQRFVGSGNNLPLLVAGGQFGTRLDGGGDAASARYIFTRLSPYTRLLFPELDDDTLQMLDDDGYPIEPLYYVPIIPMVLVNGCEGLGVGWSTQIPSYHPLHIVDNVMRAVRGQQMVEMQPYYIGFRGEIAQNTPTSFTSTGVVRKLNNTTLEITELPLKKWTNNYKEFLDTLALSKGLRKALIRDYREYHTEDTVRFVLTLTEHAMKKVEAIGLYKAFKLSASLSTNNMHLFDPTGVMKRYTSPLEIIQDHYTVRFEHYTKRKQNMLTRMQAELLRLNNHSRFNELVIKGSLKIMHRKKDPLLAELTNLGFAKINDSYDYLLNTPLFSLTEERMQKLRTDRQKKEEDVKVLTGKSESELWLQDLEQLRTSVVKDVEHREAAIRKAQANTDTTYDAKPRATTKRTRRSRASEPADEQTK